MSEPAILLDVDSQGVAELTLNRPDARNALSRELLEAFAEAIAKVAADPSIRVLLVASRGKHFCMGADLSDGGGLLADGNENGPGALRRALRTVYAPFLSVLDVEVPTIAAVQGAAIGAGLGLALACDLRLAAEDARFQGNFVRLGIHPGMAVSYLLPRVVGEQRAAELLFTGRPVNGIEAAAIGLALRAVRPGILLEEARALARTIAEGAPEAVRLTKATLRRVRGADVRQFTEMEALAQAHTWRMEDVKEGIAAWFEKRPPRFTGR